MLKEQHRPRKGVPAAQRQGQGLSPFGGPGRFSRAAEQRRRAKETEREQESTPRGGFFSGLFGGRDDDKPRKNQPPEF